MPYIEIITSKNGLANPQFLLADYNDFITDKMTVHTVRLPDNLEKYVRMLIDNGYADNPANAIKLIILDRMMADKKKRELSPFSYQIEDRRRSPPPDNTVSLREISMDNVMRSPGRDLPKISPEKHRSAEVPPGIGAPLTPSADAGNKATYESSTSNFGKISKPPYPGTRREYEEALRKGTIIAGMFEPPEA